MKVTIFTSWNVRCGIADYTFQLKDALEGEGVEVHIIPVPEKKGPGAFIRLGRRMNIADVAHIQYEYGFFGRAFFQRILNYFLFIRQIRIPKLMTLHELIPPREGGVLPDLRRRLFYFIFRRLFMSADFCLVHIDGHRRFLAEMGVESSRVEKMPHPIPNADRNTDTDRLLLNRGAKGPKCILTIFGFVSERKGYDVAIAAVRSILGCILLIAGGPHPDDQSGYFKRLSKRINQAGLRERVRITGYVEKADIKALMHSTDIVLAPFKYMAGSGSLSIAAAYHKPIIASDIAPMRELASGGLGLKTFKNGDAEDLKNKIVDLMGNPKERTRLVSLTRQYADTHSYRSAAKKTREFYEKLTRMTDMME